MAKKTPVIKLKWRKKDSVWTCKAGNKVLFAGEYGNAWFHKCYFEEFPEEIV